MRLVEAEIVSERDSDEEEVRTPPRPPRRRVYASLFVTLTVLIGTVATIYTLFPNRDNEVLSKVIELHSDSASVLENPTETEVRAWALGIFGESVTCLQGVAHPVKRTHLVQIFKTPMAAVTYEIGGQDVTLAFRRARDAPPRNQSKSEAGMHAVSWRKKRFTCIGVGSAEAKGSWAPAIGAP